jgi:hypothetical protein
MGTDRLVPELVLVHRGVSPQFHSLPDYYQQKEIPWGKRERVKTTISAGQFNANMLGHCLRR